MATNVVSFAIFSIIMAYAGAASARTLQENSLPTMAAGSDLVLRVLIERSEAIYEGDSICSIKYEAKILKELKGKSEKDRIYFGNISGLDVGRSYIIFLRNKAEKIADDGYPYCRNEKKNNAIVFWDGIFLENGDNYWRISVDSKNDPKKFFSQVFSRKEIEVITSNEKPDSR